MISQHGRDSSGCGQIPPCRTIRFVLSRRVADSDIIWIDGRETLEPFTINGSFPLIKNLTLLGFNCQPIISAKTPTYLFEANDLPNLNLITLRIEKIIFQKIGIVRFTSTHGARNISFENCHFLNIVTDQGIIQIENQTGMVYLHRCHFINNTAQYTSRMVTIYNSHSIFDSCHFTDCLSSNNGSIAVVGGSSFLKDCNFEKNTVSSEIGGLVMGGAFYTTSCSSATILKSSFKMNRAMFAGGAIVHSGKRLGIKSSSFEYNCYIVPDKWKGGGAVFAHNSLECEISKSSFIGNKVGMSGAKINDYGGATNSLNVNELIIRTSYFENNSAGIGGAVCYSQVPEMLTAKLLAEQSFFYNNIAFHSGGAIHVYSNGGKSKSYFKNCTFRDNQVKASDGGGGAIRHDGKEVLI